MKREKEQWLRIFNGVMFGALILLGFAYCDENSMGAGSENCTSYAKYEFRGKVLGESRQVVPDARILVKHIASPAIWLCCFIRYGLYQRKRRVSLSEYHNRLSGLPYYL
jgi:hypothetical protein